MFVSFSSNTTGVIYGSGTAYPSGEPEFTPDFGYPVYGFLLTCYLRPLNFFWLSNLFTLTVPDEGYSRNVSYALNNTYILIIC